MRNSRFSKSRSVTSSCAQPVSTWPEHRRQEEEEGRDGEGKEEKWEEEEEEEEEEAEEEAEAGEKCYWLMLQHSGLVILSERLMCERYPRVIASHLTIHFTVAVVSPDGFLCYSCCLT